MLRLTLSAQRQEQVRMAEVGPMQKNGGTRQPGPELRERGSRSRFGPEVGLTYEPASFLG